MMVTNARKKNTRQRGTRTAGWGRSHRGAGNRGGRGNAGSGKKADHAKRSYEPGYFGKSGFASRKSRIRTISCRDLDTHVEVWSATKKAKKDGDVFIVDLKALGYGKLIGGGIVSHKIKVSVPNASKGVSEKLKAAGGELVA